MIPCGINNVSQIYLRSIIDLSMHMSTRGYAHHHNFSFTNVDLRRNRGESVTCSLQSTNWQTCCSSAPSLKQSRDLSLLISFDASMYPQTVSFCRTCICKWTYPSLLILFIFKLSMKKLTFPSYGKPWKASSQQLHGRWGISLLSRNRRNFATNAESTSSCKPSSFAEGTDKTKPDVQYHKNVSPTYLRRFLRKGVEKLVKHEMFFMNILKK